MFENYKVVVDNFVYAEWVKICKTFQMHTLNITPIFDDIATYIKAELSRTHSNNKIGTSADNNELYFTKYDRFRVAINSEWQYYPFRIYGAFNSDFCT